MGKQTVVRSRFAVATMLCSEPGAATIVNTRRYLYSNSVLAATEESWMFCSQLLTPTWCRLESVRPSVTGER